MVKEAQGDHDGLICYEGRQIVDSIVQNHNKYSLPEFCFLLCGEECKMEMIEKDDEGNEDDEDTWSTSTKTFSKGYAQGFLSSSFVL